MADAGVPGARRPGVIASDLDGTLFGPDHELSARTIEALRAARRAGWMIVAATGRAPRSAMERLARHDVVDALVCSNGVDAAKQAADEVTGHHRDDAVAGYIEGLL